MSPRARCDKTLGTGGQGATALGSMEHSVVALPLHFTSHVVEATDRAALPDMPPIPPIPPISHSAS